MRRTGARWFGAPDPQTAQLGRAVSTTGDEFSLHSLFDGIALHSVTVPDLVPPERISQLVAYHLDNLR